MHYIQYIAHKLQINEKSVRAVMELLEQDATIPFIARYRKEATDSLDEVAIAAIRDTLQDITELEKRREAILRSLAERELLSVELEAQINAAESLTRLEDCYLPFRPKRRTRAAQARERQLEPLALWLLEQHAGAVPEEKAQAFIQEELGVPDAESALAGARDILAEMFAEDSRVRPKARDFFAQGSISSKLIAGKEAAGEKYQDYFSWDEPVRKAPAHRILALLRGETENILRVGIQPMAEKNCRMVLEQFFVHTDTPCGQQIRAACQDGYTRLLAPAMETEVRHSLKERADTESIRVFAENLRQLLLAAPLGSKRILALDPGFRTGCKFVCLDAQGQLLHYATINPHAGSEQMNVQAGHVLLEALTKYKIEAIAIGNGTAGRETEEFVRAQLVSAKIPPAVLPVIMVSENGASVYSASESAREEFPTLDLTYRGAVSIGRRLADPLAELVKIDPKAIGVGQYQHDVNQTALKNSLDDVVRSCVNAVGVNVNTASEQLLTYVSGLNTTLARNIIAFRNEQGSFAGRAQLRKVPRLGPKAFEQCAGFLRIPDSKNPLDASAVHPESYKIVEKMAHDYGCSVSELIQLSEKRQSIDCNRYVSASIGLPTLTDIMQELEKPGRDPRRPFTVFAFQAGIHEISDLQEGMRLPGIVTNITAFGAFVDIGVHQDGLVHISQLADRFVKDPNEVVRVHQEVMVTVSAIDCARKRISLSMRG